MGTQNSVERRSKPDTDLTSEGSTGAESILDEASRQNITQEANKETRSGASASPRTSTAAPAASLSQQSRNAAKSTPALKTSQPPSSSSGPQWPDDLGDKVAILMRETVAGGLYTEAKWNKISYQLRERYGFERSASGIKNYWARKGRAKYGIDERKKPRPEKMVTSMQSPETRRVARKRHDNKTVAGRRHEDTVTARIDATNLPPSSYHYQQRPEFYIKFPEELGPTLGPYGPTRNMNSCYDDQSESQPYGPTRSVDAGNSDQSESQDLKPDGPVAAPRMRLDGDRLKFVDETVINRKTSVKVNRKNSAKAKRTPETPKKYGRHIEDKKAAGVSLALFPGLVKYSNPSGRSEDLDSKIPTDGPINAKASQTDETVLNLPTSSNGHKSKKAPGSIEVSTKTQAKAISQTSAVVGKVQKLQREDIAEPKNAIINASPSLAPPRTPPPKIKTTQDDSSPTIDDGVRRSGRARRIRRWDGENYEVRHSKQARRESAS